MMGDPVDPGTPLHRGELVRAGDREASAQLCLVFRQDVDAERPGLGDLWPAGRALRRRQGDKGWVERQGGEGLARESHGEPVLQRGHDGDPRREVAEDAAELGLVETLGRARRIVNSLRSGHVTSLLHRSRGSALDRLAPAVPDDVDQRTLLRCRQVDKSTGIVQLYATAVPTLRLLCRRGMDRDGRAGGVGHWLAPPP